MLSILYRNYQACYSLRPRLWGQVLVSTKILSQPQKQPHKSLNTVGHINPLADNYDWKHTLHEAKRIVGYPTPIITLRWILNDEMAHLEEHMRKFAASRHPLLKTSQ